MGSSVGLFLLMALKACRGNSCRPNNGFVGFWRGDPSEQKLEFFGDGVLLSS